MAEMQQELDIAQLKQEVLKCLSLGELEALRVQYFGKKGSMTQRFAQLKDLDSDKKKEVAKELNLFKASFEEAFNAKKEELENMALHQVLLEEKIDPSLFYGTNKRSLGHPINYTKDRIIEYFRNLNFDLCIGPLIEDDFHNFQALNLPEYHPARDMQDTFYFKDFKLLRTHTSPVQIRTMLSQKPPIKMICPGATFRRDYDLTHTPMFHQIEGLVVDEAGNLCPEAANLIRFKVKGAGTYRAAANGDPTCTYLFHKPEMPLFSGMLTAIVQSSEEGGKIRFEASAKGIRGAVLELDAE